MGVPDCCCAPKSLRLCVEMRFLIIERTPAPRTGKPRRRRAFSPPRTHRTPSPNPLGTETASSSDDLTASRDSCPVFLPYGLSSIRFPDATCSPGEGDGAPRDVAARLRTHSLPPDIPGPNQLLLLILPPQNTWKSSTPERGNRS